MTQPSTTATADQPAKPGFLHTLPGLLTAAGSVIGAIAVLITALVQLGTFRDGQSDAAGAPAAQSLQVLSVTASADPPLSEGACPATIVLTAELRLNGAAGTVRYRWNWDDGTDSEGRELQVVAGETTHAISTEVQLGDPLRPRLKHVQDGVTLEILSPNSLASPKVAVEVRC